MLVIWDGLQNSQLMGRGRSVKSCKQTHGTPECNPAISSFSKIQISTCWLAANLLNDGCTLSLKIKLIPQFINIYFSKFHKKRHLLYFISESGGLFF